MHTPYFFYKELAATIMKADKYSDLKDELVNLRPKRAYSVVLILKPAALRPTKNWCFSLSLKARKC